MSQLPPLTSLTRFILKSPRAARDREFPILNRRALQCQVAGYISEPLSVRTFPNREPIFQVVRRNGLIVQRHPHRDDAASAIVKRNAVGDLVGARWRRSC